METLSVSPKRMFRITHVAVWTSQIETLCDFYTTHFAAVAGSTYQSISRPFRSKFLTFGDDVRLELMEVPDLLPMGAPLSVGLAHIAFTLGSRGAVDDQVKGMAEAGVEILGLPRVTGDGYYEAVIRDPDGNVIELVA